MPSRFRPAHASATALTPALLALLLAGPALAQGMGTEDTAAGTAQPLERRGPLGTQTVDSPADPVVQRTNQPGSDMQLTATADVQGPKGERLGTVAFVETPHGLLIQARLENLPPGGHGFHIHETGRCDPPDFKSAGGHYNPGGSEHGYLGPVGSHAGDLPNIYVEQDGIARVDILSKDLQIEPGTASLLPSGSKAVVIHATVDDYQTNPAGDAGNRIGCGVIVSPMADAGVPDRAELPGSGE